VRWESGNIKEAHQRRINGRRDVSGLFGRGSSLASNGSLPDLDCRVDLAATIRSVFRAHVNVCPKVLGLVCFVFLDAPRSEGGNPYEEG